MAAAAETGQSLAAAGGGQGGAAGRAASAWQGLLGLPMARQVGLMVALAASVALGVAVVLWSQSPSYGLLYGNLAPEAATEVLQALDAAGVPYRLDQATGSISVPVNRVHDARFRLAAQGLPANTELGFELLNQDQGFGTSQFVERARYQHALEVELARSITTVSGVRSARVHLAVPKQSVFVRQEKKPSASVVLHLVGGARLGEEKVSAISHIVAAAVPSLEAGEVKVVDHRGRLLSTPEESPETAMTKRQLDYVRRLEEDLVERVHDILSPFLGVDGVRAQVTADVDFTRTEETRESYNPDLPALRSEQLLEESGTGLAAGGIPGALTNQPPAAGQAPEEAAAAPGAGAQAGQQGPVPTRSRSTRNYELDRTISHSTLTTPTIRRLSVAVVVDHYRGPSPDGAGGPRALAPEEVARVEALVKEAVGFDARRGDTVKVSNVAFQAPAEAAEEVPALPIWQEPWMHQLVKQVLVFLAVALLILGVLRPAIRRLASAHMATGAQQQQAALPAASREARAEELAEDQVSLGGAGETPKLPDTSDDQRRMEAVRGLVREDPARVAQVVRNWVAEDE
jgi:flagellar M-ring protein FliF